MMFRKNARSAGFMRRAQAQSIAGLSSEETKTWPKITFARARYTLTIIPNGSVAHGAM